MTSSAQLTFLEALNGHPPEPPTEFHDLLSSHSRINVTAISFLSFLDIPLQILGIDILPLGLQNGFPKQAESGRLVCSLQS